MILQQVLQRLINYFQDPMYRALGLSFSILSFLYGSWLARLPEMQDRLQISDGELGIALLGVSIGALLMMPFTNKIILQLGLGKTTTFISILFCLMVCIPTFSTSLWMLGGTLIIVGITSGFLDVCINAATAAIEKERKVHIMATSHGMFSLGSMFGALTAGWIASQGISIQFHIIVSAILCIILALIIRPILAKIPNEIDEQESILVFPPRPVWGIVIVGFSIMLAEGAIMEWSTIYLSNDLNAGVLLMGLGFAGFSFWMAVGRFTGDFVIPKIGSKQVVVGGSVLALIGLFGVVFFPTIAIAVFGFSLAGLGLSCVVPILFSAASRVEGVTHNIAIASVSMAGIVGFLVGPPLMGFVAEVLGLQISFLVVAGLVLVSIFISIRIQF